MTFPSIKRVCFKAAERINATVTWKGKIHGRNGDRL